MSRSRLRFRLAVTFATLAVFPLLEVGLRWGGFDYPPSDGPLSIWNPAEDRAMRFGRGMFTTAPRQLWVPRPGSKDVWGDGERINAGGYRGPYRPPGGHPGVYRVLVLGESCTFGYGVKSSETFPSRLEALLADRGRNVEVLNAGVIGYTVRQGLERYRAMGRAYRPDVVVEAFGEVNEHYVTGQPPDVVRIEQPLEPGNAWTEGVTFVRENLRTAHLFANLVDGLSAERSLERSLQFRKLSDDHETNLHMGEVDCKADRRVSPGDFETALLELGNEVRADGARYVMLSLPRRRSTEADAPVLRLYTQVVEELARRENIALADGYHDFRAAEERGVAESDLYRDNWHLSQAGHDEIARTLYRAIGPWIDPR